MKPKCRHAKQVMRGHCLECAQCGVELDVCYACSTGHCEDCSKIHPGVSACECNHTSPRRSL